MKLESRPITVLGSLGTAVRMPAVRRICGRSGRASRPEGSSRETAGRASRSEGSSPKPVMSEDFFKNVQVLKGIPVDEFMGTMGFFASALSLNCIDCHVQAALTDWEQVCRRHPSQSD